HPAAVLVIPAVLVYAWVRRDRVREWGWTFFAGVVALAIVVALAPSMLLPLLAARGSPADFGNPRSLGDALVYVLGLRYTSGKGAFSVSGVRWMLGARYAWEEFLVGSLAFLAAGLARGRRGEFAIAAAWFVPAFAVPILFRNETSFDQWLVAAYLPLALPIAKGVAWARERIGGAALALAALAAASMVWINYPLLDLRRYD